MHILKVLLKHICRVFETLGSKKNTIILFQFALTFYPHKSHQCLVLPLRRGAELSERKHACPGAAPGKHLLGVLRATCVSERHVAQCSLAPSSVDNRTHRISMPLITAHSEALALLQSGIPGFAHTPAFKTMVFPSCRLEKAHPLQQTQQPGLDAELLPWPQSQPRSPPSEPLILFCSSPLGSKSSTNLKTIF